MSLPNGTPSHNTDIAIELREVRKLYRRRNTMVEALSTLSLSIPSGQFVCLLGASGCGKSTLLNLIAGLDLPTEGEVLINGSAAGAPGPDRVLMFQDAALFPWMSALSNVEFGLRQGGASSAQRAATARLWLERVNLKGFEQHYTHQLSGGMRQRVALARALAIDPAMLLMDEPFGALDALTRDRLHNELEHLWSATRKTIIFVTHNVREAVALGDRVLVFSPRPGRLIADFKIDLPRPRAVEDLSLAHKTAEIMEVLKGTLETPTDALEGAIYI